MNTKFCKTCKEEKPKSEFAIHRAMKDGLQLHCKKCKNERRQKMKENPEPIMSAILFEEKSTMDGWTIDDSQGYLRLVKLASDRTVLEVYPQKFLFHYEARNMIEQLGAN